MEILYCKNYPDGYNKISAIKPDGWEWGPGELDESVFGIMKVNDDEVEKILAQEVLDEKEVVQEKTLVKGKEVLVEKEVVDIKQIVSAKLERHGNDNSLCVDEKFEKLILTPESFKISLSDEDTKVALEEEIIREVKE